MSGLTDVLATHYLRLVIAPKAWRDHHPNSDGLWRCSCGAEGSVPLGARVVAHHRAHVAAEVRAWLLADEQVQRAAEALLRSVVDDVGGGVFAESDVALWRAEARAALTAVLGGGGDE